MRTSEHSDTTGRLHGSSSSTARNYPKPKQGQRVRGNYLKDLAKERRFLGGLCPLTFEVALLLPPDALPVTLATTVLCRKRHYVSPSRDFCYFSSRKSREDLALVLLPSPPCGRGTEGEGVPQAIHQQSFPSPFQGEGQGGGHSPCSHCEERGGEAIPLVISTAGRNLSFVFAFSFPP